MTAEITSAAKRQLKVEATKQGLLFRELLKRILEQAASKRKAA